MEFREFPIQANPFVTRCLLALFCIGTATAVFTFINLFLAAISVATDIFPVEESEMLPVRAEQRPIDCCLEIDGTDPADTFYLSYP